MCQFENVRQKNKVSHFRLALCLLSELRQIVRKTAKFVWGTHDGHGGGNSNGCRCYGVAHIQPCNLRTKHKGRRENNVLILYSKNADRLL